MKVFLSWSGESSKHIAHTFLEWLPRFFQAVEPWVSTHMPKGAVWDNEITRKLNETKAGILCLTPDNLNSPYLHYEAGAISNVGEAVVYTFLYKVEAIDVKPPLSRFQNTKFNKEDIYLLMQSINERLILSGETHMNNSAFEKNFELFYPILNDELGKTPTPIHEKPKRKDADILEELLTTVRGLQASDGKYNKGEISDRSSLSFTAINDFIQKHYNVTDELLNENIVKLIGRDLAMEYPKHIIEKIRVERAIKATIMSLNNKLHSG